MRSQEISNPARTRDSASRSRRLPGGVEGSSCVGGAVSGDLDWFGWEADIPYAYHMNMCSFLGGGCTRRASTKS